MQTSSSAPTVKSIEKCPYLTASLEDQLFCSASSGTSPDSCPRRRFGKTGLLMPIISCGGMRHKSTEALTELVADCLNKGINHFETAAMYMAGKSERDYGEVVLLRLSPSSLLCMFLVHVRSGYLSKVLSKFDRGRFILQTKVRPEPNRKQFREKV